MRRILCPSQSNVTRNQDGNFVRPWETETFQFSKIRDQVPQVGQLQNLVGYETEPQMWIQRQHHIAALRLPMGEKHETDGKLYTNSNVYPAETSLMSRGDKREPKPSTTDSMDSRNSEGWRREWLGQGLLSKSGAPNHSITEMRIGVTP